MIIVLPFSLAVVVYLCINGAAQGWSPAQQLPSPRSAAPPIDAKEGTSPAVREALASTLPAGVLLFWVTSNLFAVARGAVARTNAVRRALGVPLAKEVAALAHLPPWRGL